MAVLQVARLGNPILREKAKPVDLAQLSLPGANELQTFIDDMIDTMRAEGGVGLAAPQVSRSLQIVTLECEKNRRYPDRPEFELVALVNPVITWYGPEKETGWEACLSVPGLRGLVPRPVRVKVEAYDRAGDKLDIDADGFMAVVLQHEIDHLNGIVYIERMDDITQLLFQEEYDKYREDSEVVKEI
jgi:peptide deformylase